MEDIPSLPTSAEVDRFIKDLFGATVSDAGLHVRSSTNTTEAAARDKGGLAQGCEGASSLSVKATESEMKALHCQVHALQRENALYRAAVDRLRQMVDASTHALTSGYTAEIERLAKELARSQSTVSTQAAELQAMREQAQHAATHSVQLRVDGMQNQIDDLRYAVRELSVQASQSRAVSVRSPPGRVADTSSAVSQDEAMTLRRIIRQQQQTIAALQESANSRPDGTNETAALVWEDPDPELELRGTNNLHSPSRASGRVVYADDAESPHPAGLVRGVGGHSERTSVSSARCAGGSEEPEPQIPLLHGKATVSAPLVVDKENVRPNAAERHQQQQPQPPPLLPRRAQVTWEQVEEILAAERTLSRPSDGSDLFTGGGGGSGGGVSTPPPRATILLNGMHGCTLSLDETYRSSCANTTNLSVASPDTGKKRTASPDGAGSEVAAEWTGARTESGPAPPSHDSDASSDVSYIGRKPRGAISLSMPRRSFGSCEDDDEC